MKLNGLVQLGKSKKHSRTSHVFCFYLNLNRLLLTFYNRLKMKGKIYKNGKVKGFTSENDRSLWESF